MASLIKSLWTDKQSQVVAFSSTAIALYGYDQGMMSLINTNYNYLGTMGIAEKSPLVGLIVSVYYLGCAVGAVIASWAADRFGRKASISACLATAAIGNLVMFVAGLGYQRGAIVVMFAGRVIMGLGVGGIDSVVPIYSSELSESDARGKALAQEFQANILGLNLAYSINLATTFGLGKENEWAWRIPIILMQLFPVSLMAIVHKLPESPRFLVMHDRSEDASKSLQQIYPDDENKQKKSLDQLQKTHQEEGASNVSYFDMLTPGHDQFHPTIITIMGQVNQALTGYGAVSVYGSQIFELLGWGVQSAEIITEGNYFSYLCVMTLAWMLIDAVGRRNLMLANSVGLVVCFALLTGFGALAQKSDELKLPWLFPAAAGSVTLFVATANFGVGWLTTVWLVPTEIYPTAARAKGTAISVIIWGLANFAVTLLTPVLFNGLDYWLFAVFAVTNLCAGLWTLEYLPETGNRSFEENQEFFQAAKSDGSWRVAKVAGGEYRTLPGIEDAETGEREPLLDRVREQIS